VIPIVTPPSPLVQVQEIHHHPSLPPNLSYHCHNLTMRFGKTLQSAIYPPWRDHYIEYSKLKRLLREGDDDSDAEGGESAAARARLRQEEERPWTEHDESVFVEELVNVQLEKVHSFQLEMSKKLKERTEACEQRLERLVKKAEEEQGKGKGREGEEDTKEENGKPFVIELMNF